MSCEKKECNKMEKIAGSQKEKIEALSRKIVEIEAVYEREIKRLSKDLEKALQIIEDKDRVIIRLSERFAMKPE